MNQQQLSARLFSCLHEMNFVPILTNVCDIVPGDIQVRYSAMELNIPLTTGQSVLVIDVKPDGTESKEILNCSDKFTSCVGSTGSVRIAALSKLGTTVSLLLVAW